MTRTSRARIRSFIRMRSACRKFRSAINPPWQTKSIPQSGITPRFDTLSPEASASSGQVVQYITPRETYKDRNAFLLAGAGYGFLGTDDQHVGDFLHLRIADLRGQLFVAVIEMHADAVIFQRFVDVFRVVLHFFADRADFHLNGGKPQRKGPGVM